MKKPRILISVTIKKDIEKFKALADLGWEIISTGGTADTLKKAGIPVTLVEDITQFPEMLDGRLKTLHPKVHGGLLADRSKPEHMAAIKKHDIQPIDVVVVNLYEFEKKPGIENIDIGGPTMLRSAGKNGASVTVVVDPEDYDTVITEIVRTGETSLLTRERLTKKAFWHTARYDEAISLWMDSLPVGALFSHPAAAH